MSTSARQHRTFREDPFVAAGTDAVVQVLNGDADSIALGDVETVLAKFVHNMEAAQALEQRGK